MKELYGVTKDGLEINKYTLENSKGMRAVILDFGAILDSLYVPDAEGRLTDVILSCPDADGYTINDPGFGAVIGPNANRIADAVAEIDGKTYNLEKNDGENNLHTSKIFGTQKRHWDVEEGENSITLSVELKDGELGLPGNRTISITYSLTEANELVLSYSARSDSNTIFNLTNHAYFNLRGHNSGRVDDHILTLSCSKYTKIREGAIPTGEIVDVAGTELDFTAPKAIGKDIASDNPQMVMVRNGYDFNYCVDDYDGSLKEIAVVKDPYSGRVMKVSTTLPGVHFYTGNWLIGEKGKNGSVYHERFGMAFETQYYPDSIHHDNFPDVVFGPGRDYSSKTVFKFN